MSPDPRQQGPWEKFRDSKLVEFITNVRLRGCLKKRFLRQPLTEFSARFPYPHFLFEEAFWVRVLTWTVLSIEGLGALLIWSRRWRPYVLLAIYGLHLAIDYSMNLFLFQWVMIVGWTSFLDRSVLQVWGGHWRRVVDFVFKKGGLLDVREKQ